MVAVPYGNKILQATGEGTQLDPAIVHIGLRVRRESGYGAVSHQFPLPIYAAPVVSFAIASRSGNGTVLAAPPLGKRYWISELFLSASSGTGTITLATNGGETLGMYPVAPRVMAQSFRLNQLLTIDASIIATPSDGAIVYGGFFLGRVV